jgi:plastocyanin
MPSFSVVGLTLVLQAANVVKAADIEGTIVIEHVLTKRHVTAAAGGYQRGVAEPLGADAPTDALSFERSRVVIFLEGEQRSRTVAAKPLIASMEQKSRRFIPDVLAVPAGSTVSFPNSDRIFHNVFSLSKLKTFDLGNYPQGHTRAVTFPEPGVVFVYCRLHPNMTAAILVAPNPWCTKSDAAGHFVISGAPAGPHTVVAWHKAAGLFRKTIQVDERHGATVRFFIPIDENGLENPLARR